MKKLFIVVMSMFALTVFAAEPAQTTNTPTTVKTVSKMLSKKSKRQLKALMPVQASNFLNDADDYGPADSDDLDVHVSYARPRLITITDDNVITSTVLARLKVARQLAVRRHQKLWCGG